MNYRISIAFFCVLMLATAAVGCSTGANLGSNPENSRLLLTTFNIGGTAREVQIGAPRTSTFPALTYYVFGSNQSLGNRSGVPLQSQRLDEQAVATLAFGDPDQTVDLTPWAGYQHIYVRCIVVEPNVIWEIVPGTRYEFWGS